MVVRHIFLDGLVSNYFFKQHPNWKIMVSNYLGGGGFKGFFKFHPENWGNDSQFDGPHIFLDGLKLNHQLVEDSPFSRGALVWDCSLHTDVFLAISILESLSIFEDNLELKRYRVEFFLPQVVVSDIWVFPRIGVGPQNGWFIMEN